MSEPVPFEQVPLGQTDIRIPRMGIGTWAWGDRVMWGFGREYNEADLRAAFRAAVRGGVPFFDTAEVYGWGRAERFLGTFLAEEDEATRNQVVIATKFFPYPWRWRARALRRALEGSLRRLRRPYVDLYQIHWPWPPRDIRVWVRALAEQVQAGLARAAGVSNYNLEQMKVAEAILADHGLPLASNQLEYSLLRRDIEFQGLLDYARSRGITILAYSPLAMGMLT
ncbi:MAG: aldo/keto reductase, partial [Chloroflexi bacterium]|nr:aldo/keto reductase [Chloroflexota bacterium]